VMFTGAFTFYFLIGALFLPFGSDEAISRALAYYPVDAIVALRADAVNAFGFGIAVIAAVLAPRGFLGRQADRVAMFVSRVPGALVMLVLMFFSVIALSQTWAVDFGYREGVVAGIWRTASRFTTVAIYLGAAYRGRHERKLRTAAAALALAAAAGGLMLFSKTELLVSLGAFVAGLAVRFGTRRVLPMGLITLLSLYVGLGGVVAYGRAVPTPWGPLGCGPRGGTGGWPRPPPVSGFRGGSASALV